ncbi:hypothetical protein [Mycoplasmopsis iners]|uniref:hypothetical protein n=1 Tax=Mycoplasmopsis iners TaxID=76630 RepID=UPI000495D312|nr:hypothetical protein [Mycoplasmopsis iners]
MKINKLFALSSSTLLLPFISISCQNAQTKEENVEIINKVVFVDRNNIIQQFFEVKITNQEDLNQFVKANVPANFSLVENEWELKEYVYVYVKQNSVDQEKWNELLSIKEQLKSLNQEMPDLRMLSSQKESNIKIIGLIQENNVDNIAYSELFKDASQNLYASQNIWKIFKLFKENLKLNFDNLLQNILAFQSTNQNSEQYLQFQSQIDLLISQIQQISNNCDEQLKMYDSQLSMINAFIGIERKYINIWLEFYKLQEENNAQQFASIIDWLTKYQIIFSNNFEQNYYVKNYFWNRFNELSNNLLTITSNNSPEDKQRALTNIKNGYETVKNGEKEFKEQYETNLIDKVNELEKMFTKSLNHFSKLASIDLKFTAKFNELIFLRNKIFAKIFEINNNNEISYSQINEQMSQLVNELRQFLNTFKNEYLNLAIEAITKEYTTFIALKDFEKIKDDNLKELINTNKGEVIKLLEKVKQLKNSNNKLQGYEVLSEILDKLWNIAYQMIRILETSA